MRSEHLIAAAVVATALAIPQTAEAQWMWRADATPTWEAGIGAGVGVHLGKIDDGRRRVHGTVNTFAECSLQVGPRRGLGDWTRGIAGTAVTFRSGEQPALEWTARGGLGRYLIPSYGDAHLTFGRGSVEAGLSWRPSTGEVTPLVGLEGRLLFLHAAYRFRGQGGHTLDAGLQTGLHLINMNESSFNVRQDPDPHPGDPVE